MGFLETKVKKAWGRPTVYYKLNRAALEKALLEYLVIESEKIKSRSGENADSLTEITSEITYRENNGALSSERHEAISLDKYLKTSRKAGLQVDEEAVECIRYFLEQYESQRMEAHPRLRYGQWETYVDTVLSCTDSFGHIHHFTSDELKLMIDDYFKTGFEPGCDYRLMHFNTDGVKAVRMYQAA